MQAPNPSPPTSVNIRRATTRDAASIARVDVAAWLATFRGIVADSVLDGLNLLQSTGVWLSRLAPEPTVFVAVLDGTLEGFCWVRQSDDPGARSTTGEVHALYVHPDAQRRGIGSQLLEVGLDQLRQSGSREATLWAAKENSTAIQFYEAHWLRADGASKNVTMGDGSIAHLRYRRPLAWMDLLRLPQPDDAEELFPYVFQTRVTDTIVWDGPESKAEFLTNWHQTVAAARAKRRHFFVICDPNARQPIGCCDVRPDGTGGGTLGLWVAESFQGSGIGTQVIQQLVTYSFHELGLSELEAMVFTGNEASRRIFEKNGFTLKQTVPDAVLKRGRRVDEWTFSLANPNLEARVLGRVGRD